VERSKDILRQGGKGGNKGMEKKRIRMILTILAGILILIIGGMSFYLVRSRMTEKNYTEAVTSAEKYLAQNDYEDAIIQYKKAISVNQKDEEAYIGLADVYILQQDFSKAKAILNKGYGATKSVKIKRALDQVENESMVGNYLTDDKNKRKDFDLSKASANIKLDASFYQKLISYTFEDFKDEFGSAANITKDKEGYLEVNHPKLDGMCYYRNTGSNKDIVDESRRTPKETGMPEKISLNSLGLLFRNFEGGISLEKLQMVLSQRVRPVTKNKKTYIEANLEDCILRIETDSHGNVVDEDAWNEIILINANHKKADEGHLSGVVLDAVTGDGVADALLAFEPAWEGGESQSSTTDGTGIFSADLEPGRYKVVVSAEKYIQEEFTCEIEEGKTYSGIQYIISPDLASGTARIVLEWNAQPRDLDSYLFGETDAGNDVLVKYSKKEARAGEQVIASLDLDDMDGYGPETTTIYDLNGVYTFQAADYNRTGTMKEYGASVKVYLPGKKPEVISIDPGADVKDIWIVCEIDHGKLNIINEAPDVDRFTPSNK